MDPVSSVAAVLQLAQMAGQTAIKVHDAFSVVRNAPNEIGAINRDVRTFATLVESLEASLKNTTIFDIVTGDPEIRNEIVTLKAPIDNCNEALIRVLEKMEPHSKMEAPATGPETDSPSTQRARLTRTGIMWFFRRREIYALAMDLERTKATFDSAMGRVHFVITLKGLLLRGDTTVGRSHKFNEDVGSSLRDYASSIAPRDSEDSVSISSRHSLATVETQTANLPSGPKAAEEIKLAVSHGAVLFLKAILTHAHVDARDRLGRTALSHAAEQGKLDIAKTLLEHGASATARQWSVSAWVDGRNPYWDSGATPLYHAIMCRHHELVELLLEHGENPQVRTTQGVTPISMATKVYDVRIVKLLLSKQVDVNARYFKDGFSAVHKAASFDDTEILQLLLDHGAFPNLPTLQPSGKTPLHFAVTTQKLECMKLLLKYGADPNSLMLEDITALHLAATTGWLPGIELLMEHNVPIDARDALLHETPLHKAARNRQTQCIERLCQLGADQQARNVDGQTYDEILQCAVENPEDWKVPGHLGMYISTDTWLLRPH